MNRPERSTFHLRYKQMVRTLREEIYDRTYEQGDFLPSENALIKRFSLSKSSVRAALDELVKDGLIEKLDRVGSRVCMAAPAKVILRFGVYPSMREEANMNELLDRFNEQYPQIEVRQIRLPYNQPESIRSLMQHGVLDLLTLNLSDYVYLKDQDSLSLLEQQKILQDTYPFLNDLFLTDDNSLAVQPFIFSPVIMAYNKDHLRGQHLMEPDSSWTWDDLHRLLQRLKEPHRYTMFFHPTSINRWPLFLLQHGVRFARSHEGKAFLPTTDSLAMLRMLRELMHEEGIFPLGLGEYEAESLFLQKKVSVIITTYFRMNHVKDADFTYDIAQVPRGSKNATLLLSCGIAACADSPQKEAVRCLIDFLVSEDIQTYIRKSTFSLPANKWITESVHSGESNPPSRFELHRELIPYYTTLDQLGLSMKELLGFSECLKQYFSKLIDESELVALFSDIQLTEATS